MTVRTCRLCGYAVLEIRLTLTETVAWYKAWQARQDMRAFTLKQIDGYMHQTVA